MKLWLTSFITIGARLAPHDNGNFLEHAKFVLAGKWFGPYDELTLIKGPGIVLYLALIRELGLPLALAHQCLYALSCVAVCCAVAPLVRRGRYRAVVFTALIFNPFTFSSNAWALNRSQLTDSLTLLFIAGAAGAVVRATARVRTVVSWLALLGFAFSALWLTREDTVWTLPALAFFLGAYLWRVRTARGERRFRAALALMPALMVAASIQTVATINGAVYGWRTTVETTSPEFVAAYQSLARIEVPGVRDNRIFPAPRAAREMAARVSPAAADVERFFDRGGQFQLASCVTLHLCNDVSAGWFLWAVRGAAADAGYYASGTTARRFYVRLANEVDSACADHRLACRPKNVSLAPAVRASDVPAIVSFAVEAFAHAATFDQVTLGAAGPMSAADESVANDYANVTGSAGSRTATYRGWLVRARGGTIRLAGKYATDFLSIDFEPSPDVEKRFGNVRSFSNDDLHRARFVLTTSCVRDCVLLVGNGAHGIVSVPLDPAVTTYAADGLAYHLDFSSVQPVAYASGQFKETVLRFVLELYGAAVPASLVLAVALVSLRAYRIARRPLGRRAPLYLVLATGCVVAFAAQCTILGIVSAVSFYALFPEYEAALYPLVLALSGLVAAAELPVLDRALRARRRQLSARSAMVTNSL